jgi:hypothetical protein
MTKQYLPAFQPSKQVTSDLVRARTSLIFPSSVDGICCPQGRNIDLAFAEARDEKREMRWTGVRFALGVDLVASQKALGKTMLIAV